MSKTFVKVLIEGYARRVKQGYVASSTCCLVTTPRDKIITDPGCNRKALVEALHKEHLDPFDVDYVFLSHGHIDHILLASFFENAKFITYDYNLLYHNDYMQTFKGNFLDFNIDIIQTPGHTAEHLSMIVPAQKGIYAICGDVFWYLHGEKQTLDIYRKEEGADMKLLVESRKKILQKADFIIPGHGKVMINPRQR